MGVPAVVQWDHRHLVSAGTQVQSFVRHSGLRKDVALLHLHLRSQINPWTPSSMCCGQPRKKVPLPMMTGHQAHDTWQACGSHLRAHMS